MANMDGLRQAVSEWVMRTATDALDRTYTDTVDAAPENTGALRQLIATNGPSMTGDFVAEGEIRCDAEYAIWTDKGSDEHVIEGNPLLAFYWEKVGKDMVLPRVTIPAQPGTQWFNSGEDDGEPMASRWARACESAAGA